MENIVWFAPILPGKLHAWRDLMAQAQGPRREEHRRSRRRLGVTREVISLMQTPQGDFVALFHEGESLNEGFTGVATSSDPYDVWYRDQILQINGITAEHLQGPRPAVVEYDYRDDELDTQGTESISWFTPILPGKMESWRAVLAEMAGPRAEQNRDSRRRAGLGREVVAGAQTPQGDFACLFHEARSLDQAFDVIAHSPDEYDVWFRDRIEDLHGITLEMLTGPRPATLEFNYRDEELARQLRGQAPRSGGTDTD